jgi:hypothetical protein
MRGTSLLSRTGALVAFSLLAGCASADDEGDGLSPVEGAGGSAFPDPGGGGSTFGTGGYAWSNGGSGTGNGSSVFPPPPGNGGSPFPPPGGGGSPSGTGGAEGSTGGAEGSTGGAEGSTGGSDGGGDGTCCSDGNCLCHGPDPTGLPTGNGPFKTANYTVPTGVVYYPTDAEPPFAGVALCGGFLNTGPEMVGWGSFYASYGIVTIITATGGADLPDLRGTKLVAAIGTLKSENTKSGGQLFGKMSDRYGTSGYSMGGGGTTLASAATATLKTSVGLAPWGGNGAGVKVPTLLLCGSSDTVAPCSMSQGVYRAITDPTPKMMVTIAGATHFSWFGPADAGRGASGAVALAFQKVYLEGDTRWKPFLSDANGTVVTNIQ